jgi:hypothetical protein
MSSSLITGGEAGPPSPAEIFVYPIFIRALARSLRLSYREELRQPLRHALLPPWLPADMSKARLCMPLAEESWVALWNARAVFHMKHSECKAIVEDAARADNEAAAAARMGCEE